MDVECPDTEASPEDGFFALELGYVQSVIAEAFAAGSSDTSFSYEDEPFLLRMADALLKKGFNAVVNREAMTLKVCWGESTRLVFTDVIRIGRQPWWERFWAGFVRPFG